MYVDNYSGLRKKPLDSIKFRIIFAPDLEISTGDTSPLFFCTTMNVDNVKALVTQYLSELGNEYYLVDVTVSAKNKVIVTIDHDNHLAISDCVKLSRWLDAQFDREQEDFELEVGSPGIDQPFKVDRQYVKNAGKEVSVVLKNGQKVDGALVGLQDDHVVMTRTQKVKIEGKKGKQTVTEDLRFPLEEVKETKLIIKF